MVYSGKAIGNSVTRCDNTVSFTADSRTNGGDRQSALLLYVILTVLIHGSIRVLLL